MKKLLIIAVLAAGLTESLMGQAVVPGWLTDPTVMKGALGKDGGYKTPEAFKYPYVSTYYLKPTVTVGEDVRLGFYVTDFESSRIRFLDDSHRFSAFLEYRLKGSSKSKVLTLRDLKSGDAEFRLGRLPAGEYELRVWVKDAKGRESHRVIHDFRVMSEQARKIPAEKVYRMTAADLAAYGIRNDGDIEQVVCIGQGKSEVLKRKRAGTPGYTVTVPLDPKTDKVPYRAFEKASVVYDPGYDKAVVEAAAVATAQGLQKIIDEKAAAGFRKFVMLPGTYRVSHTVPLLLPDRFVLDLGEATLKLNAFAGERSVMVRMASVTDSHLVRGTIEGDYWTHDYKNSPKDSEWVNGFQITGDSWYCSVEGVTVKEIAGYGGSNHIEKDSRGSLAFMYESLPRFEPGGLNPKTGKVDASDKYRFTTGFRDLRKITGELGRRRLQISKYLGYQGVRTRSWLMTVAWYDEAKTFISAETAFQYREMWIPENAAYLRVSIEESSLEAANPIYTEALSITAMRYPVNCAVKNCRFERCRCVGYAAAQMKNWLFAGNHFTTSGEAEAKCAFDAEDGADQMQDVYFLKNVFRDNPINNSILTCAGHNFILEKNDGGIHFWGRTYSPCVRDNTVERGTFWCDSRLRSGYGRFEGNRYTKGFQLGMNEMKDRPDNWDYVISRETFDGDKDKFTLEVGRAGRLVGCTFRNMPAVSVANAFACSFENCKGWLANVRWTDVTVKDSEFKNFFFTNVWNRCRFQDTRFESVGHSTLIARNCDFTNSKLSGFNSSTIGLKDCTFGGSAIESGWWNRPADLVFKNCKIATRDDHPFLKTGVYAIGNIRFDGCSVTGKQSLVHVGDLRPHQDASPATSPDLQPGEILLKGLKWSGESKTVVTHSSGRNEALSSKKITIDGSSATLPSSIAVATDLFPSWKVK